MGMRLTGREWWMLLTLAGVQFTNIVDFMLVMPLGPQLKAQLSLSPRQFGLVVTAYAFAAGVSGLLAAVALDRFDRKRALLFLYGGFTVGTLLCGLAPDYEWLLAARVVAGLFGGVMGAVAFAIVGDSFADERRGTATGVLMTSFSLATVAGVPIGMVFADTFLDWHTPFLALAAASAGMWLLAARALAPVRGHIEAGRGRPPVRLRDVMTRPTHLRAFALMCLFMFGGFTVIPYLSIYMVANVGLHPENVKYIYLAGGAATLVSMPVIGRLSDRFGKLRVLRIVAAISIVPLLLTTHLPPVPLAVVLLTSTFFFVVVSGRSVPAVAMVTAAAAPRYRGSFMSVNSSVQQIAAGLACLLSAAILGEAAGQDLSDPTVLGAAPPMKLTNYGWVGWIAAAGTLASMWLAGRLRPAEAEEAAVVAPPKDDTPIPVAKAG